MSAKKLPMTVHNIQQIPENLSMSRFLPDEDPPSPEAFPLTQKIESPERPTYTSQLRQNNMMKRYKIQKNVESKVISVTSSSFASQLTTRTTTTSWWGRPTRSASSPTRPPSGR